MEEEGGGGGDLEGGEERGRVRRDEAAVGEVEAELVRRDAGCAEGGGGEIRERGGGGVKVDVVRPAVRRAEEHHLGGGGGTDGFGSWGRCESGVGVLP